MPKLQPHSLLAMAYHLSATKLQHYSRCPRAYYYRYERGLPGGGIFGSAALGNALHRALAAIYQNWHYHDPLPPLAWLRQCWDAQLTELSPKQVDEGWQMLQRYYERSILPLGVMRRPIAVEGRIQGTLVVAGIEFALTGRYDRLDALESGGLALVDYKSSKETRSPSPETIDLQLGLYYLALEQRYHHSLRWMSLVYLQTGEERRFEASPDHKHQVETLVEAIALKLHQEEDWQPVCGSGCDRCSYRRYCPAVTENPDPLPTQEGPLRGLQLSLGF